MPQGLGSFSVTRMLICCLFNVVANLIYSFSRPGKSLKQARSLKVLVLAVTYLVPLDHLACVVAELLLLVAVTRPDYRRKYFFSTSGQILNF